MQTFAYPKILNTIFRKLQENGIKPIIVGGYVRDALLEIDSKDIDVELYKVKNIDLVIPLLKEFGSVNEVGKSFQVIKLTLNNLDLDFSLPREDSKTGSGHRGFEVKANAGLDFKSAASRRDFTINSIGYDVLEKKLLDPYNGIKDLQNRVLRAVDSQKFGEDPLRVLRAVQFAARFSLTLDPQLSDLCQKLIGSKQLQTLSKERIFTELEKLLLKAQKPSYGFQIMQKLGLFSLFSPLKTLTRDQFEKILKLLDQVKYENLTDQKQTLITMLLILTKEFDQNTTKQFLEIFTDDKEILSKIQNIKNFVNTPSYTLAMRIDKNILEIYLKIIQFKNYKKFLEVIEPKIHGKDLIDQGLKPSKEFSSLLEKYYQDQIRNYLL